MENKKLNSDNYDRLAKEIATKKEDKQNINNPDFLVIIGKNLRELRLNKGISILDASLECEMDSKYLGQIETGKRNPTINVLIKLADFYGVNISDIFKGI